eukprot:5030620-Pleurochrysis_carterae.AAC.1
MAVTGALKPAVEFCRARRCSYLLLSGEFERANAALEWYGWVRTYDGRGVTIPSQQRYVKYAETLARTPSTSLCKLPAAVRFLKHVRLYSLPDFDGKGGCQPQLQVMQGGKQLLLVRRPLVGEAGTDAQAEPKRSSASTRAEKRGGSGDLSA